jgi:hypothetical protein
MLLTYVVSQILRDIKKALIEKLSHYELRSTILKKKRAV